LVRRTRAKDRALGTLPADREAIARAARKHDRGEQGRGGRSRARAHEPWDNTSGAPRRWRRARGRNRRARRAFRFASGAPRAPPPLGPGRTRRDRARRDSVPARSFGEAFHRRERPRSRRKRRTRRVCGKAGYFRSNETARRGSSPSRSDTHSPTADPFTGRARRRMVLGVPPSGRPMPNLSPHGARALVVLGGALFLAPEARAQTPPEAQPVPAVEAPPAEPAVEAPPAEPAVEKEEGE